MKIFWSWQNDLDTKTHRSFIKSALAEAIKQIKEELDIDDSIRPPELDHDTKDELGMVDIANAVIEKIRGSALFVADITPLQRTPDGKALPNPNVMFELGLAFYTPGVKKVVGIFNNAEGWKNEDLPFDIRHRRLMQYTLPIGAKDTEISHAKKKLVKQLTDAIRKDFDEELNIQSDTLVILKQPSLDSNPSIWAPLEAISYTLGSSAESSVEIKDGPRGYIRVIPAGWVGAPPSVYAMGQLSNSGDLMPPIGGSGNGDYGHTDKGFVRFWHSVAGGTPTTAENFTYFFQENGEIWTVIGEAVKNMSIGKVLYINDILSGWIRILRQANRALDSLGAKQTRYVEVGLFGVKGLRTPAHFTADSAMARKNDLLYNRQSHDWSEQAQLNFLIEAYNKMLDVFGLPSVSPKAAQIALKRIDENIPDLQQIE